MKKNERIPLSPCLRRFKFFFDLLKQTTDNYLFFADMQEDLVIVSPNLVQDFDLPAEVMHGKTHRTCCEFELCALAVVVAKREAGKKSAIIVSRPALVRVYGGLGLGGSDERTHLFIALRLILHALCG